MVPVLTGEVAMTLETAAFLRHHCKYPLYFLVAASALIITFNVDKTIADYFYQLQGKSWLWKNTWLAETVLHKGGRTFSILLALLVLVVLVASYFYSQWNRLQKPLWYLLLALLGSSLLVSALKASLAISCPWEFEIYGGHLPYVNVIQQLQLRNGDGCFPAGHASAGYCWVALYFFGLYFKSPLRWTGLGGALFAGIIFGFAQQIRGAHFISHDLWTLAICWFFCLALYLLFFEAPRIAQHTNLELREES
jgi:membrane-associated PAP2 superfamily phosphatase